MCVSCPVAVQSGTGAEQNRWHKKVHLRPRTQPKRKKKKCVVGRTLPLGTQLRVLYCGYTSYISRVNSRSSLEEIIKSDVTWSGTFFMIGNHLPEA